MIKKYKPEVHKVAKKCGIDCKLDCGMECNLCRNTPFDTDYYYIIEGNRNHNVIICNKCFKKVHQEIKKIRIKK
jgi:hypothetical protein